MSGSFAAPRLLSFNATPHGSRRGLLSDAAPQLTASLEMQAGAREASRPSPVRCAPLRRQTPNRSESHPGSTAVEL